MDRYTVLGETAQASLSARNMLEHAPYAGCIASDSEVKNDPPCLRLIASKVV